MYGVSPAWFLSLHGDAFTCSQAAESLPALTGLGYRGWQPEIFLPEALKEWESGAGRQLMNRSSDLGMDGYTVCSSFPAARLRVGSSPEFRLGDRRIRTSDDGTR